MRKFAGKTETKAVPFMDGELVIRKLSAGAVKRIGEATKVEEGQAADPMAALVVILNEAVVLEEGEAPIDEALLDEFPLDVLNDLAGEIMSFAGVAALGNDAV